MNRNGYLRFKGFFQQRIILVLFGVFLLLMLLEVSLRLSGFILLSIQEHKNRQSIKQKSAYRILCLGESTTQNQYPQFLEQILNQRNIGVRFSVIDKGRIGTNTPAILSQVEVYLDDYQPDMVVTMMGYNDEGIMYYQDIPESGTWLFKYCRVYRFGRIIYMHILNKLKQEDAHGLNRLDPNRKVKLEDTGVVAGKTNFFNPRSIEQIPEQTPELNPKNDEAYVGLGWFYQDQGKFLLAEEAFKKALELNPKNGDAYAGLGWLYQDQGKFLLAEEAFKKSLELNPKNDDVYAGLGWLYRNQGKFLPAEEAFKKSLELNPKNDNAYAGLGGLYRDQGKFLPAEEAFKKSLELDPKNDNAYAGLGWLYRNQGKFLPAEEAFKKSLELDPKNDNAYAGLGGLYRNQGKFLPAEAAFKKALELNPKNDNAYAGLGWLYQDQGKFLPAEEAFKKAIEFNLGNIDAYIGLGWFYQQQSKFPQAEEVFKKVIKFDLQNDNAYVELGRLYRDQGKFLSAEEVFKKALELNPENDSAYIRLGGLYRDQGKFLPAEAAFKKASELNPKNDEASGALSILYEETGRPGLAKEYAQKVNMVRLKQYSSVTINSYHKLKLILDKRKISLVCVQYPMRNVEPLKKIFEQDEGVVFVDNESVFKKALKGASSKEYFIDMFGGDFGHCTEKGNQLLAENIANVILKEKFE